MTPSPFHAIKRRSQGGLKPANGPPRRTPPSRAGHREIILSNYNIYCYADPIAPSWEQFGAATGPSAVDEVGQEAYLSVIGANSWGVILLGLVVANFGQAGTEPDRAAPVEPSSTRGMTAQVGVDSLEVWDAPREAAYGVGRLQRGDRVRVRGVVRGGWLAIEPPSWAICWVERGEVELGEEGVAKRDHRQEPPRAPSTAWVKEDGAVVRSGNPRARLPGPPRTRLAHGTMVRMVDRPSVSMRGSTVSQWHAVAPPEDLVYFIRAGGLEPVDEAGAGVCDLPHETVQVVYQPGEDKTKGTFKPRVDPSGLPREVAAELASIDAAHRAVVSRRGVSAWRFEAERARAQAILKRAGDGPGVREAVEARLERLDRDERAAAAARDFEATLAHMRKLDGEAAAAFRRLAATESTHPSAYTAAGFMKPSNQFRDGRKLYALIGTDGKTSAFLDLPPGLELEPILAAKVGVRGRAHFDQDLGVPLITVREVEPIGR